jgi:hypothetical protein
MVKTNSKKKGKAVFLLRELKDALTRLKNPVDISIVKKTGRKNQTLPLKKITTNRSQKRKMESKLFSERLNKIIESEKSKDMRRHLKCFEDYGEFLKGVQRDEERKEMKVQELLQIQKRLLKINQLKRYLQFKNSWDNKSKKQWCKNQQTRKRNVEILKKIEKHKIDTQIQKTQEYKKNIKNHTYQCIDEFEQKIRNKKNKKEKVIEGRLIEI